ncbi:peritrophin-1 [Andrena cerasifolii]|uniref:peritrophin-1 n=1 Tax=Andrena cerasifolii TaxID=2819439 RepID=UPI004037DC3E
MKAIFVAFAIFAVYLYAASSQRVACPTDWSNIKEDYVLVPHPCDCSTYYVCQGEMATPMPCPAHLHFNSATKQCDYVNKAHCQKQPGCYP